MQATPREVALRILEELFGVPSVALGADGEASAYSLADFQAEGVARARAVLDRRGGAILADSVGLGKTYMALALIEEALRSAGDAVVVVPASLRGLWRRALGRLHVVGGGWRLVSHTQLARGVRVRPQRPGREGATRLVVVDEAHRFRNPGTLRYAALARLVGPGTRTLLLTATPVNNRAEDLLHLIRLFAPDDAFRDVGVSSLRHAFTPVAALEAAGATRAGTGSDAIASVVRAVVVRRTRAMVRDRFGSPSDCRGVSPAASAPRFPRRAAPRLVRYTDPSVPRLVAGLTALELAAYQTPHLDGAGSSGTGALIRLGLLKRLDSSPRAFRASLDRLAQVLRATHDAAVAGRVLLPRGSARPGVDADPLQLTLIEMVARPAPPDFDLHALRRSVERDATRIRQMTGMRGPADPKLAALDGLLMGTRGEKTLVFTEYRDTAAALWRGLGERHRVGRVDGGGAWLGRRRAGRRTVVERFAPHANGRRPPHDRERVDVLIATDVLAEGLNLQDARHVVSYELPWNPVRLLQRIGRVDRLGSPHAEIVPYLFAPDNGIEAMLGLARRVRTKLDQITATVGGEQAHDLLERLSEAVRSREAAPVALAGALERAEDQPGDPTETLRTLWIRNRALAGRPLDDAPSPGPVVATMAVPPDAATSGIAWLLMVQHRGAAVLLEVGADGVVREAGVPATVILALGLGGAPGSGPPSAIPSDAIEAHLARADATADAPPRLSHRDPGLRLMRRVRRTMARAGVGLDPGIVARADTLLERLASPLDPAAEERLRNVLERTVDPVIVPLLEAAESALGTRVGKRHGREPAPRGITVLAALEIRRSDAPPTG